MNNEAIIKQKYAVLSDLMEKEGSFDVRRAQSLISDLKAHFVDQPFLTNEEYKLPIDERVAFRTLLEYDAIVSIKTRSLDEFSRVMSQLKREYFGAQDLPQSQRMPLLVSIYLVHILTLNSISEFNIEYQHARKLIGENKYLDYVADLYLSVTDNSFSRLFTLELEPPSELFCQFTADLLDGARNNHADSIEKSYATLSIPELAKILYFKKEEDAQAFAVRRNWKFSDDKVIVFDRKEEVRGKLTEKSVERFVDLAVQISSFA